MSIINSGCLARVRRSFLHCGIAGMSAWGMGPSEGWAQVPSIGEVQAQQEAQRRVEIQRREAQQLREAAQTPSVHSAAPQAQARTPVLNEVPCAKFPSMDLRGPSAHQFTWLRQEFIAFSAQCLGVKSLGALQANLNDGLAKHGYVTSKVLIDAEQALRTGKLSADVMAGRVGEFRLLRPGRDNQSAPVQLNGWPAVSTFWMAMPSGHNQLLNLRDLDQAAENIQRLPGYAIEQYIVPKLPAMPGQDAVHDIVVQWQAPEKMWNASVGLDNSSSRSMGRTQIYAQMGLHNLLGLGEQTSLYVGGNVESRGPNRRSTNYSFDVGIPFGYHRFRWQQSSNRSAQGIAGTTINFTSRRYDDEAQLLWQWTFYRDDKYKLGTELGVGEREGTSHIEDVELVVQRRHARKKTASVVAGWQGAGQSLQATFAWTDTTRDRKTDDDYFFVAEASKASTARLTGYWNAGAYTLQWDALRTRRPTPLSDVITMGGRYSVRGFTGDTTLSASEGVLLRQEWQFQPLSVFCAQCVVAPYIGLDVGKVWGSLAPSGERWASGAALGVRMRRLNISLDVALAVPLSGLRKSSDVKRPDIVPYIALSLAL